MMPPLYKLMIVPPAPPLVEYEETFYSDPNPEVTSVDGHVGKVAVWPEVFTWAQLRDGSGTLSADDPSTADIDFRCDVQVARYNWMRRFLCLFDTFRIPVTAIIQEASLSFTRNTITETITLKPIFGTYGSFPLSNTALVIADYQRFLSVLLSSTLTYAELAADPGPHTMVFTQAGLDAIAKGGITKLAIRDANRDGPNNPVWESRGRYALVIWSAEAVLPEDRPYLTVKWLA